MKKYFLTFFFLLISANCSDVKTVSGDQNSISLPAQVHSSPENSLSDSDDSTEKINDEKNPYPGITIDQKFPIAESYDFSNDKEKEGTRFIKIDNFQIKFDKFTPKTIDKNGKSVFKIKTLYKEGYWANLVGMSNLLGENSKQIYIVASGTGGVCCTNYWINDISSGTPRNIFRSEDFGGFRDAMEVFDADGDGIYELVQFDSTFRYFMGDCGACSPEPRAVFKYDKKSGQYLPAKNIQQDFIRESFLEDEKWISESFEKLKKLESNGETETQEFLSLGLDYNHRFLDHVVDIFYLGDEEKAWKTFEKYSYYGNEKVRAEIKKRLRESKFYQALKKSA